MISLSITGRSIQTMDISLKISKKISFSFAYNRPKWIDI